jgi:hypothetical protein
MNVCVTNTLDDFRSCTVRGEHAVSPPCDGYQHVYDSTTRRVRILDVECTGCKPTPAELGHLCHSHMAKLDDAVHQAPAFAQLLWGLNSNGVQADTSGGGHAAAGPRWPLVESRTQSSWVVGSMLNAVRVLDGEDRDLAMVDNRALPVQATPREVRYIASTYARILNVGRDELVSTEQGAAAAVYFIDYLQRAMHRFPTTERSRRIAGIRCERCHLPELIWKPPLAHLGDVVITCGNCPAEYPQEWLEQWSEIMRLREQGGK